MAKQNIHNIIKEYLSYFLRKKLTFSKVERNEPTKHNKPIHYYENTDISIIKG